MKIKIVQKQRLEYIIVIFILMFCINVTSSIFRVSFYYWIPLVLDICGILIYSLQKSKRIKLKFIYYDMIKQFFLPLLIPSMLAAVTSAAVYHNSRFTLSSFKYVLWVYGAYLLGYFLIQRYKFKAFYLVVIAGTISYITVIIKALYFKELGYLEVHELTYIYGMLFIFFMLYKGISKKRKIGLCLVCFIGVYLGGKRALWLAMAIALAIYILFYKILKNKTLGLRCVAFGLICVAFIWVWFIKAGYFEMTCMRFGINDMSRLKMWNYFRNDYEMSLGYLGRGLTYTDVVMSDIHSLLHISTAIPIHNCILKMYIGWGFVPFAYYLYAFLYKRVLYMTKKGAKNNAWLFLAITIVFYIINFLGDTLFNMGISIVYAMIWTLLQNKDNLEIGKGIAL